MFIYTVKDIIALSIFSITVLFIITISIYNYLSFKIKQWKNKEYSIQSHNKRVIEYIKKKNGWK